MARRTRVSTLNLVAPLIITCAVLVLGLLVVWRDYGDALERESQAKDQTYEAHKQALRFAVENAISYVQFRQSRVEEQVRSELRARVDEALAVVQRDYESAESEQDSLERRDKITRVLESMRFHGGTGYYFVYTLEGAEVLSFDRPRDADAHAAADRRRVVAEIARIAGESGEGYYSYPWPKPGAEGAQRVKLSFVRRFAPYHWFVGVGEYVEDIEADVQRDVLRWLAQVRSSSSGYLWVHDESLRMVSHPYHTRKTDPGWYETGGLRDYADPNGVRVFVEMQRVCREQGGGFVSYLWGKPGHEGVSPKLSYVERVPDSDWIIGAGVYTDDVEAQAAVVTRALGRHARLRALALLALVGAAFLLSVALTRYVHCRVTHSFHLFDECFREAALSQRPIDAGRMPYAEFSELSAYVNRIVEDRKAADEHRRRSDEQLLQSRKMEVVGRLAGGIAHDFNNLLGAMMGFAEMGLMNARDGMPVRPALEEVLKYAGKATAMTGRLLEFSRKHVLHPTVMQLNETIASLDDMLRRLVDGRVLLLEDLDADLGLIEADAAAIERVLVNLVVNARDAMQDGGTLRIVTRNEAIQTTAAAIGFPPEPGTYAMMEVSDTGHGMDEATLAHLFEPYFTTKDKGTGFGLSTVYGIIRQSRGYVTVHSERDHGTVFRIYLPAVQSDLPRQEPDRPASDLSAPLAQPATLR